MRFVPIVPAPGAFIWPPWLCLVSLSPGRSVFDFAGALEPPLLASDDVLRLDAPAPGAPPVPVASMLDPVLEAPAPPWAKAEG
ncbi:hypothetical protein A1D31_30630 [Bradyrhizobium liaoningense]|nr:hypothetical protein A1D31_30630 [Bradyrhizobium liaoningense]